MMEPDEVYSAILFFPNPEHKSIEMIMDAPNFINLDINQKYGGGAYSPSKRKCICYFPEIYYYSTKRKNLYTLYQDE